MITGVVSTRQGATIRLAVRDAGGREHEVEAILDTGFKFNGSVTSSPTVIAAFCFTPNDTGASRRRSG